MKKSVIKRRKRVVPVPAGGPGPEAESTHSAVSPDSDDGPPAEESAPRGSLNSDGSVSLGFRRRVEPSRNLPELASTLRGQSGHPQQQQQMPANNLAPYASSNPQHAHQQHAHDPSSLNPDNRLPPMAAYPSPSHRPSSLSPNFLLTPSRKRSFSATVENEAQAQAQAASEQNNPTRLSSIKSILNPAQQARGEEDLDPSLRTQQRSPGQAYAPVAPMAAEQERAKGERREMLQREAERMREELRAKERELEELGL